MATFEDIQKANSQMTPIDVKGRQYMEVNQRVKAFRMLYPEGCIRTKMESNENGVCVFKAEVYQTYKIGDDSETWLLATGWAYEKESSSYINRTSYIENCETSAVGRALGFLGIGIDTSIASAEEVQNAQLNQPLEKKYIKALQEQCKKAGKKPGDLEALKGLKDYDDIKIEQWQAAMQELGAQ